MLAIIDERYPGVTVAGARHGYFSDEDEPAIAEAIRESGADYLFLGMTTPKKEQFIERWGTTMGVKVCHGVGGSSGRHGREGEASAGALADAWP